MQLSVADLFKTYSKGPFAGKPRIVKFAEKFKTGEEFELNNGRKIKLKFDNTTYNTLVDASKYPTKYQKELQKAQFPTVDGKSYYKITDFKKTIEFDGRPDKPPAGIEGETKTVARINVMLKNIIKKYNYKDGVPIICRGKIAYAVSCIKVPGTPKSDLALIDKNGKEVVWISYKMGRSVKDFQQWGGITEPQMQKFPQVQEFIQRLKKRFPQGIPPATNVGMHIKGKNSTLIKKKAVYGVDYEPGAPFGRNNVSFVVQGRLDFKAVGKNYTITSTTAHAYENGTDLKSSEDPIFYASHRKDRNQFDIKYNRSVINPYGGTTIKEWLD